MDKKLEFINIPLYKFKTHNSKRMKTIVRQLREEKKSDSI